MRVVWQSCHCTLVALTHIFAQKPRFTTYNSTDPNASLEMFPELPSPNGDDAFTPTEPESTDAVTRWCNCDVHALPSGVFGPLIWVVSLVMTTSAPSLIFIFVLVWALLYASLPLACVNRSEQTLLTSMNVIMFACLVASYTVNIPFLPLPEASINVTAEVLPSNEHLQNANVDASTHLHVCTCFHV